MYPRAAWDPMEKLEWSASPSLALHCQFTIQKCALVMDVTFQQLKSMWLANIVDLLDFPVFPLMNLTSNETLWLTFVY
jgi:hypothetical protein